MLESRNAVATGEFGTCRDFEPSTFSVPAKGPPFRVVTKCLQTSALGALPRSTAPASPQSVPSDADALPDCWNEKDLQMQIFSEAAEGIRTLDLLHGKQTL
jgi:hypothetical protein